MSKKYLMQIICDDDCRSDRLCSSREVIKYVNESDFNGMADFEVYDVSEFGVVERLHYKGWQPNCLIEFVDDDGNLVISGYGEDH